LALRVLVAGALATATGGCSYAYIAKDGTRYIFGFGVLQQADTSDRVDLDGTAVRFRSIGLYAQNLGHTIGGGLGYVDARDAVMRNSASAGAGPRSPACASRASGRVTTEWVWGYKKLETTEAASSAGPVVSWSTVGIGGYNALGESAVSIGYDSTTVAAFDDDVFVACNPALSLRAGHVFDPATITTN
jgi:hypothetical protein